MPCEKEELELEGARWPPSFCAFSTLRGGFGTKPVMDNINISKNIIMARENWTFFLLEVILKLDNF